MTETTWHKVMVPNDSIISTNIENFSTRKNRKTTFIIWITYDTTTLKLQKWIDLIKEILEKYKTDWTISSYRVNFSDFWEFSLNINVLYYSLYNQNLDEYHRQKEQINFDIKKAFDSSKIDIAFPTQEIIVKK
jgi:small-conductance mechanosensitive channel